MHLHIFFRTDKIDSKTLGMLALVTESKHKNYSYFENYQDIYDLYLDSSNNITIEKHMDTGSAISKKYFRFHNHYIVVSENKKTDFIHYYDQNYGDEKKGKKDATNETKDETK